MDNQNRSGTYFDPVAPQNQNGQMGNVPPYSQPRKPDRFSPPWDPIPGHTSWNADAPADEPKTPQKKGGAWKVVLGVVLAIVLTVGSSVGTAALMGSGFEARISEMEAEFAAQMSELEQKIENNKGNSQIITDSAGSITTTVPAGNLMTPAQVYQQNLHAVVMIENVISSGFYSSGGTGSGFVLTADGYVVTNYHVVEGGGKLTVITYDGTRYEASLVGYDNANDVALLKVEANGLQPVVVGDSDQLIVGDQVAAIGNPLGELTSTMTVGYVSAKERHVNTSGFAINMIQTDAAINSGNSGGPLFNMYGQVVGITSAKYSGSSSTGASIEGIGFAIPINDVLPLLTDLVENGYDTGPYLGISVQDMNAEGAEYYGLPMGAYVEEVVKGSCADRAGVQPRDIITAIGDYGVTSVNELSRALRNYNAGDTITVTVYRGGKEVVLTVTLDQKPQAVTG